MAQTKKRDTEKAAIVSRVARICGLSTKQVRRVISGNSENEEVMKVYMEIAETGVELDNKLIQAVKKAVPFN